MATSQEVINSVSASLKPFIEKTVPAQGLPASAYTDQEFWQTECETVLSHNWVCAGFAHELENPGDCVPTMVAGKPVMLVKNEKGEIAAFHNVCRHRCLTLVDEPKNVGKLIKCPYHAWAYDLDGHLRASPHFGGTDKHEFEGFERSEHSLFPIRVHVWHD